MTAATEKNKITIEEIPVEGRGEFWDLHMKYLVEDGIIEDEEDVEYFSGEEYRGILQAHMLREKDRHNMVWFCRGEERIGAASYCTYRSEHGKCFVMDFWVYRRIGETAPGTAVLRRWSSTRRRTGRSIMRSTARRRNRSGSGSRWGLWTTA